MCPSSGTEEHAISIYSKVLDSRALGVLIQELFDQGSSACCDLFLPHRQIRNCISGVSVFELLADAVPVLAGEEMPFSVGFGLLRREPPCK
jgi:hypothetical protein